MTLKKEMAVELSYLTQCMILGTVLLSIETVNDTSPENMALLIYFDGLVVKHGVFELQKHCIHTNA